MCGRFAFFSPSDAVVAAFGADINFQFDPRYNIAPSQAVTLLRLDESGDLRTQLSRFQTVASQGEALQSRLGEIRSSQKDADLFLEDPEFDEAAASMSGGIVEMVRTQANEGCQIVSRQPVRPKVQERFQRVTVNVRMRCDAEEFIQILHSMETGTPLMLVDDLNIIRPRTRRSNRSANATAQGALDIRFNVSGYLK